MRPTSIPRATPIVTITHAGAPSARVRPRMAALAAIASLALGGCQHRATRPAAPVTPAAVPAPTVPATASRAPTATPTHKDVASRDEVVKTAVAVFGDSLAVAVADSLDPAEPVWDLDVRSYETHDRVEHYVDLFTNTARERFVQRLSRGTRYEPMIRAKLRASGMPEDLTYLALIESGYDPHAYSRAAAVGMWQFMSSTARDIGLRVDWWMDERRDPARATDGAIRFLGILQKQFGSYYLAAAAYNGGPGRVSRGLTRFADELEGLAGEDRFFALAEQDYLRAETKNYVPQLIAAALVAKMPAKYGIVLDSQPAYAYDSVQVAPGTSLGAIAIAGGVSGADLKDLNPAILRGVTPPDGHVWVRLPVGTASVARARLDSLDESALRGWDVDHVPKSTMTAAQLADRHGVTLKQLRWFNPTLKTTSKGRLVAGQTVRIPRNDALALARELPDPSIERYGSGSATLSARGVHVVKRGETLRAIARRYGLSESRLKSLNGMRGTRLIAGQTLVIRGAPRSKTRATVAKGSAKSSSKASVAKRSGAKASTSAKAKKAGASKAAASKGSAKKATAKKGTAKKGTANKSTSKKKSAGKKKR